ncbi:MAG: GH25 family lysozyme [Anaerostipes faecalis]|nr:GH25 family lysozyme [Anaerostipes faecalis]
MRRSEKLFVFISFIIGLCLLLFSSLMLFCDIHTIWASENQNVIASDQENNDCANSWRFKNGNLKQNLEEKIHKTVRAVIKPDNASAQGVDVSKFNGDIDWEAVQNSGKVDFAIIRCGYGRNFEYADDPKWERNTSECERLGIPYGVYLYGKATSIEAAKSEAQHVIRLLNGKSPTYPVYYDMEDTVQANLGAEKLGQIATAFFNTLESAGYTNVGVYANLDWFNTKLTAPVFNQYPRWVAQYNSSCTYKGSYHMWQYSDREIVDGINGTVDYNYKIGNWTPDEYVARPRLSQLFLSMTVGQTRNLTACYSSKNGYKSSIQWTTSNSRIASVTNGKVVTRSAGKVTISASLSNGKRAYCTVTIKPKTNRITKLKRTGKKSIKIYWTKVSGTTGYQVYMSTKKNSGYKRIKTVSGKYSSYTKGKLKKGKRYYFKVRSYKKVGGKYYISSYSTVKTIKR